MSSNTFDLSYTVTLRKQYQQGQMQLRLFYIYYLKREKHFLCLQNNTLKTEKKAAPALAHCWSGDAISRPANTNASAILGAKSCYSFNKLVALGRCHPVPGKWLRIIKPRTKNVYRADDLKCTGFYKNAQPHAIKTNQLLHPFNQGDMLEITKMN